MSSPMDLDELECASPRRRTSLAAHLCVDRLDQGTLAHATCAPQQRVVGGKPLGEAQRVVEEHIAHPVDALEQAERHAIDLGHGQEGLWLGLPNEGLRLVEVWLS